LSRAAASRKSCSDRNRGGSSSRLMPMTPFTSGKLSGA
jgi:hypothetical protein